jgi:hypothetical protein
MNGLTFILFLSIMGRKIKDRSCAFDAEFTNIRKKIQEKCEPRLTEDEEKRRLCP